MKRPPIRVLDVAGSPGEMGRQHGMQHADEIRSYAEERVRLVMTGTWSGGPLDRGTVLDLADACLPAHESFSPTLHEEMLAMAGAAGITPAEAIVGGGFTDFVDTVRANLGGVHPPETIEDDCTAFIVPDHRADGAGFYGQTWDMHDSATDYVVLLRTRPSDAPASLVFTTTGCLGQIGMNELGVCVGINNLTASDGGIGVTWPSVVREALHRETAGEARDVILEADLAGGHNFMVFDAEGEGYNIEAMPTVRPVTPLGDAALSHTNHTTVAETQAVEGVRADALQASSHFRLETAETELDRDGITAGELMTLTGGAVCQVSKEPSHIESSGATIMRPRTREFWACWGLPSENDYQQIAFAGATA
ncbi:MAG: C45 family autoproteolytic acyltransferase/hydrolase [Acidimicrobiales bacterium]|nr:C45 family autoproteolytic acyltransferase/hydrolase [Acidimicrobiales bacterium]